MDGGEGGDAVAEVVVEIVERGGHVGEQGVAADRRDVESAEDGGEGWDRAEGAVGVPLVLVREHGGVTGELDHVVDGVGRLPEDQLVVDEGTEPRREVGVLLSGDVLVAEDEHLVLEQRVAELVALVVRDGGDVDCIDVCTEGRADRCEGDVVVGQVLVLVGDAAQREWPRPVPEHAGMTCHRAEL